MDEVYNRIDHNHQYPEQEIGCILAGMPHKYEYRDYIEGLDCYGSGGHIPEVLHTLIEPFDGKEAE